MGTVQETTTATKMSDSMLAADKPPTRSRSPDSIFAHALLTLRRTDPHQPAYAARRAARQMSRALVMNPKNPAYLPSHQGEASLSDQMRMDMDVLFHHTSALVRENHKLRSRLSIMSRLSEAQAARLTPDVRKETPDLDGLPPWPDALTVFQ